MDSAKTPQHLLLYLKYWYAVASALAVRAALVAVTRYRNVDQSMLVFHENMDKVKSRIGSRFQGELSATLLPYPEHACDNETPWQIKKGEEVGKLWIANLEHALENNKVSFAVAPAGALLGAHDAGLTNWLEENGFDIRQPSYD